MEELEIIIGRNTNKHREANIHIGENPRISHIHAKIELDVDDYNYYIINLSKNGLFVKQNGTSTEVPPKFPYSSNFSIILA